MMILPHHVEDPLVVARTVLLHETAAVKDRVMMLVVARVVLVQETAPVEDRVMMLEV
jgi:hypothetical protein